jgi:hypothetical protein
VKLRNSTQFGRKNPFKGRYVDMCCDTLSWSMTVMTDFMLVKMVRLIQVSEKITETFGSPYDLERGRSFAFLLEGQARSIRIELDKIAEQVGHQSPNFRMSRLLLNTTIYTLPSVNTYQCISC